MLYRTSRHLLSHHSLVFGSTLSIGSRGYILPEDVPPFIADEDAIELHDTEQQVDSLFKWITRLPLR